MKFRTLLGVSAFTLSCLAIHASATPPLKSGIDRANMDPAVRVQDDLYLAVNGTWLKKTEIPSDKSNYGAFTALDDQARDRIHALIEDAASHPQKPGSDAQKVGDMYRSFMDEKAIEARGLSAIQPQIDAIKALKSPAEVAAHFAHLIKIGVRVPYVFDVSRDEKNSSQYITQLHQGGTGLPDRDYYLKDDAKSVATRASYVSYISTLLTLAGEEPASASNYAQRILELETALAKVQSTRVELRDPEKNYNKMPRTKLSELAPDFNWQVYFETFGLPLEGDVIVGQPAFVKGANEVLKSTPLDVLQKYLTFHLLDAHAVALPVAFQKASFELHGKVLAGIPEDQPRWKKAVDVISGTGAFDFGVLGDALGKLYVAKYFPPESKKRIDELVRNLLASFNQSIDHLTWMTDATKKAAHEKLAKYSFKVGYTKKFRDYSALQIKPDDLMGNLLASERLEFDREFRKLGRPVDRDEWHMTPQTVNAYYSPTGNEIVFPAAILLPPFFDPTADDATNYGAIGGVIGHETSHGFDDQGSQFDGDGNLRNWWTDTDKKAFKELTERLVAQYNSYEPLPGEHLNGQLTLGENIADLSGLAVSYRAYQISLHGKTAPVLDGLTGDQRFFMGWAQVWARKYREAEILKRIRTDPHSPSQFRANGVPTNMDAFYKAFDVKPTDKMYKPEKDRIVIW